MGKIHHDIGSTEFKVWSKSLQEFSEQDFINGIKATADHLDYLDLPKLRNIIRLTRSHKSHRMLALDKPKDTLPPDEIRARIAEMRKNLGI